MVEIFGRRQSGRPPLNEPRLCRAASSKTAISLRVFGDAKQVPQETARSTSCDGVSAKENGLVRQRPDQPVETRPIAEFSSCGARGGRSIQRSPVLPTQAATTSPAQARPLR